MRRMIRWSVPAVVAGLVAVQRARARLDPAVAQRDRAARGHHHDRDVDRDDPARRQPDQPVHRRRRARRTTTRSSSRSPPASTTRPPPRPPSRSAGRPPDDDEILSVTGPGRQHRQRATAAPTARWSSSTTPSRGPTPSRRARSLATAPEAYTGELTLRIRLARRRRAVAARRRRAGPVLLRPASPPTRSATSPSPRSASTTTATSYSCGPTGFSNAADYAQISTDGGDQFHLIGEPPRGQQGSGGGGDCGLAFGVKRNARGQVPVRLHRPRAADRLHDLDLARQRPHASPRPARRATATPPRAAGADRQWMAFLDDDTVLLTYNQQQPRNVVVQRSDRRRAHLQRPRPGRTARAIAARARTSRARCTRCRRRYPTRQAGGYVAFYGWNASGSTDYSTSTSRSPARRRRRWHDCRVAPDPGRRRRPRRLHGRRQRRRRATSTSPTRTRKAYHSYLTTLTADKSRDCTGANTDDEPQPTQPGLVDAGPGRPRQRPLDRLPVARRRRRARARRRRLLRHARPTATRTRATFKATWDVYVNQSLNALGACAGRSARSRRRRTRSTTTRSASTGSAATSRRRRATARWPTSSRSTTTRRRRS